MPSKSPVEQDIEDYEDWITGRLNAHDYYAINQAAYRAAVWVEDNTATGGEDSRTTLNNCTSMLVRLASSLARVAPQMHKLEAENRKLRRIVAAVEDMAEVEQRANRMDEIDRLAAERDAARADLARLTGALLRVTDVTSKALLP